MTKKVFRRLAVLLPMSVLVIAVACVPKIQPTPFVRNLNDYYARLAQAEQCDSTEGLAALDASVCRELRVNEADAEMHMLSANILLSRFRRLTAPKPQASTPATSATSAQGGATVGTLAGCNSINFNSPVGQAGASAKDRENRKKHGQNGRGQSAIEDPCNQKDEKSIPAEILRDVFVAQEIAKNDQKVAEWVVPRSYIILGDLMLLVARNKRDDIMKGQTQGKLILLAYYEVAAAHYTQAYKIASTLLGGLASDRRAIAIPALTAQLGYAKSGAFAALTGKARALHDLEPDRMAATLQELDDLNNERPEVWNTLSAYLPTKALDERDTYMLGQYVLIDEARAFSDGDDVRVRASLQRSLRLSVLSAFHKSPGDLPVANNETSTAAALLQSDMAPSFAKVKIDDVVTTAGSQSVKLTITPSPKDGFNIMSIPTLILKVGDKRLQVPQPMENGAGIVLNNTRSIGQWTISLSADDSSPTVNRPSSSVVVEVKQPVRATPNPFFTSEDKGKTLEIYDTRNLRRDSFKIP
jgi:hypothetical protein